MQSQQNNILVVEPNINEHSVFKLTNYKEAYDTADIIVFLVAHREFMTLEYRNDKIILDFAGVFKKS
jgi:UDP-N-acetyl-D-mannosaminuronic acid dehydrogenase